MVEKNDWDAPMINWDAPVLEIIDALERRATWERRWEWRKASRLIDEEVAAVLAVDSVLKKHGIRVSDEEFSRFVDEFLAQVR